MTRLTLRRNPFDFDLDFPRDVERFLGRPFSRGLGVITEEWFPMVDIAETKDEVIVKAEVPGMTKADISMSLQDNVLTLRGEKEQEKETHHWHSHGHGVEHDGHDAHDGTYNPGKLVSTV